MPFIGRFMTPTGQLVPRRRTRLQQKVHRHLCRQVREDTPFVYASKFRRL